MWLDLDLSQKTDAEAARVLRNHSNCKITLPPDGADHPYPATTRALLTHSNLQKIDIWGSCSQNPNTASFFLTTSFLQAVPQSLKLQELSLVDTAINDAQAVVSLLRLTKSLNSLTLVGCTFGGSLEGLEGAVLNNKTITKMDLSALQKNVMLPILKGLKGTKTVKDLHLGMHYCTDTDIFQAIEDMLTSDTVIESFECRYIKVQLCAVLRGLVNGMNDKMTSISLQLVESDDGGDGERLFEGLVRKNKLRTLRVSGLRHLHVLNEALKRPESLLLHLDVDAWGAGASGRAHSIGGVSTIS